MSVKAIVSELAVFSNAQSLAYPSANAINGGQLNSEENIRDIITRVSTKSFVIRRLPNPDNPLGVTDASNDYFSLSYIEGSSILYIAPGECNIRGYYFRCKSQTAIDLNAYISQDQSLQELFDNWNPNSGDPDEDPQSITLSIYMTVKKDSAHHILSYMPSELGYTNFLGVVVDISNDPSKFNYFDLLLGTIEITKTVSGFEITDVTNNENKFKFLDADDIFHYNSITQIYESLQEYIEYLISQSSNGDIHDNLTVFGPTIANDTTNIYITSNNGEKLFRLYYDYTNNVGGLALYSGSLDNNGKVDLSNYTMLKDLMRFSDLPEYVGDTSNQGTLDIGTLNVNCKGLSTDGITTLGVNQQNTNILGSLTMGVQGQSHTVISYNDIVLPNSDNLPTTTITDHDITANKVYGAVWA